MTAQTEMTEPELRTVVLICWVGALIYLVSIGMAASLIYRCAAGAAAILLLCASVIFSELRKNARPGKSGKPTKELAEAMFDDALAQDLILLPRQITDDQKVFCLSADQLWMVRPDPDKIFQLVFLARLYDERSKGSKLHQTLLQLLASRGDLAALGKDPNHMHVEWKRPDQILGLRYCHISLQEWLEENGYKDEVVKLLA